MPSISIQEVEYIQQIWRIAKHGRLGKTEGIHREAHRRANKAVTLTGGAELSSMAGIVRDGVNPISRFQQTQGKWIRKDAVIAVF